jgi:hypothetical protein
VPPLPQDPARLERSVEDEFADLALRHEAAIALFSSTFIPHTGSFAMIHLLLIRLDPPR